MEFPKCGLPLLCFKSEFRCAKWLLPLAAFHCAELRYNCKQGSNKIFAVLRATELLFHLKINNFELWLTNLCSRYKNENICIFWKNRGRGSDVSTVFKLKFLVVKLLVKNLIWLSTINYKIPPPPIHVMSSLTWNPLSETPNQIIFSPIFFVLR